jgi:hypothetical protein
MNRREFLFKSSLTPLILPISILAMVEPKKSDLKFIESPDIIYTVYAGSLSDLANYIETKFLTFVKTSDVLAKKDENGCKIQTWHRVYEAKSKIGVAYTPIKVDYTATGIDTRLTDKVIDALINYCNREEYTLISKIKCHVELDRDILVCKDIISFMCEIEGFKRVI